ARLRGFAAPDETVVLEHESDDGRDDPTGEQADEKDRDERSECARRSHAKSLFPLAARTEHGRRKTDKPGELPDPECETLRPRAVVEGRGVRQEPGAPQTHPAGACRRFCGERLAHRL